MFWGDAMVMESLYLGELCKFFGIKQWPVVSSRLRVPWVANMVFSLFLVGWKAVECVFATSGYLVLLSMANQGMVLQSLWLQRPMASLVSL